MTVINNSKFRRFRLSPWRDLLRGRVTGRLDWKLIIADSQLPEAIQNCIFYVVKKTRLWLLERSDVAHELIAHFNDAMEAGEEANVIVTQFGDQKLAAKLIRRAKLRQRPLPWKIYRWGYRSLIAMVLLYIAVGVYFAMGSPEPKTDYLAQINQNVTSVPADQRAWPLYRQALLEMGCGPNDQTPPVLKRKNEKALLGNVFPGDEHWPIVRQFLKDHADSIELLRQASLRKTMGYQVRFYIHEDDEPLLGKRGNRNDNDTNYMLYTLHIPHVSHVTTVGKLLIADLYRAAEEEDSQAVIANVDALFRCATQLTDLPYLYMSCTALKSDTDMCRALSQVLEEHAELFSDQQIKSLAHRIASIKIVDYMNVSGERILFNDLVQRMYTDDEQGNGRMTLQGLRRLRMIGHPDRISTLLDGSLTSAAMSPAVIAATASRQDLTAKYDQIFDMAESLFHVPLHTQPNSEVLTKYYKALNNPSYKTRYLVLTMMLPPWDGVRRLIEREQAEREGLLLGLALESYRRAHGSYPTSLDELSPAFIPALPIDRITGEALKYIFIDNRPVIYSVGADRDDDGGLMPYKRSYGNDISEVANWGISPESATDGDWVIWPLNNPPRLESIYKWMDE